jgi:hypothetical protein
VANYLIENKVRSTWFITHDSPEIRRLLYCDLFEVGIHPNFGEESTQGRTPSDVMANLLRIAPEARSTRTHSLIQSTPLLRMMREKFNVLQDVSLFLPSIPNIVPHRLFFSKDVALLRIPYFWEDDYEMINQNACFSLSDEKYHVGGIKIFNFHPIHIVLNSHAMEDYYLCRSKVNIAGCTIWELQDYINTSQPGVGMFFRELAQLIKNDTSLSGVTISELASRWMTLESCGHRKT